MMATEDLERRLERYGDVLEDSLEAAQAATVGDSLNPAESRRWVGPMLALVALTAVVLGVLGAVSWRGGSDESELVATGAETEPTVQDSAAVQQCRASYEILEREFQGNDQPGIKLDPTIKEAESVTLNTPGEPDASLVILRGQSVVMSCRQESGNTGSLPDTRLGAVGLEPDRTGIEVWDGGLPSATNGPVTLSFHGRVGEEVVSVAVIAGAERTAGVVEQGWFLAEVTLLGSLSEFDEIAIEWTNSDGSHDSRILLEYDADLRGFIPRYLDGP